MKKMKLFLRNPAKKIIFLLFPIILIGFFYINHDLKKKNISRSDLNLNSFTVNNIEDNSILKIDIPTDEGDINILWPERKLIVKFASVEMNELVPKGWEWKSREQKTYSLGDRPGTFLTDKFINDSFELIREIWIQSNQSSVAIRYHLTNKSKQNFHLKGITPFSCMGDSSLILAGADPGEWEMISHKRDKNGTPVSVRLGIFDDGYRIATNFSEGPKSKQGNDGNPVSVQSDPFCVIRKQDMDSSLMFVGFLGIKGHLVNVEVKTDSNREKLDYLKASCDFSGSVLNPAQTRSTNWFLIMTGNDVNEMIFEYADRVGNYYDVSPPKGSPPAVFSSWYYYTRFMNEDLLTKNINKLEELHFPYDVFQLDDGWEPLPKKFGDWHANKERWPKGMKWSVDKIIESGHDAGIWLAPYLASTDSKLANDHPEWLMRDSTGNPILFRFSEQYGTGDYVLDPTAPGFTDYLKDVFGRLGKEGFTFFKLDFMRAASNQQNAKLNDPNVTSLEAYELGLMAIREAVGKDAHINICGGHFGGSLGIANSQRNGSDTRSWWVSGVKWSTESSRRQLIYRTWMSRLWHTDPDAVAIKRQEVMSVFEGDSVEHTLGLLNDDEAITFTLFQYITGGITMFSEPFYSIDKDRLALYRHFIPSVNSPSIPLDAFSVNAPSYLLTNIVPKCKDLAPWKTIVIINWKDELMGPRILLDDKVLGANPAYKYLVWEFIEQKDLGIFQKGDTVIPDDIRPHASKLIKLIPWDSKTPKLVSTDLHFSGGGIEISEWHTENNVITGKLDTQWKYPVIVTAAFPDKSEKGYRIKSIEVPAGNEDFKIEF